MRVRTGLDVGAATGSGASPQHHAPIAGDDYAPPSLERTRLIGPPPSRREWSREEKQAYIEHLEHQDKPVKVSPIQPHVMLIGPLTGAGAGVGKVGKYLTKAALAAANQGIKAYKKYVAERKKLTVDPREQAANARALRDSIDRHHERMTKDPTERAREQRGIERGEDRQRKGDRTMVA